MKNLIIFFILLSFTTFPIFSQKKKEKLIKQCDAQLARQLVEQQAIESKSVSETDKRINILIRVAEFLWDKDEDSARKYFSEAFKIAKERFKEKGTANTSTIPFLVNREKDYRYVVIQAIAKFDASLAKKFNEEVLNTFDEESADRDVSAKYQEIYQTLQTAVLLVDIDPAIARSLLSRAMKYPLENYWYSTLYQIAQKDKTFSDQLYLELLSNYRNTSIGGLLYLSAYPFGIDRIFGLNKYTVSFGNQQLNTSNQNLQKQFLVTLLSRINKLTPETANQKNVTNTQETTHAVSALAEIEPIISTDFPELKPSFIQAQNIAKSLLSTEAQAGMEKSENNRNQYGKSFDEFIEDIENADKDGKLTDQMIISLIFKAEKEKQYEKAATYLDKIKDEKVRESGTNYFYFARSKLATKENRFADARKYAENVPQIQHRSVLYFDIAELKLKEPLTRIETLEVLTEVYKMADKAPDSVEKAQVLLGLAFMYEKIDTFNAFDSLSNAIKTANNLENPNLFTSFISQQIIGKDFATFAGYSVPGFDLNRTFDEISKKDFQGALAQAKGFSDKYVRTLAILATVKGCEQGDPQEEIADTNIGGF